LSRFLEEAAAVLTSARPTAENLKWADSTGYSAKRGSVSDGGQSVVEVAEAEARAIEEEDIAMNRSMGEHGADLFKEGTRVLTHCNAGALATGGYGTALGVIRSAHARGSVHGIRR
jgi:methylthioribose-1-phosphate isomerase